MKRRALSVKAENGSQELLKVILKVQQGICLMIALLIKNQAPNTLQMMILVHFLLNQK